MRCARSLLLLAVCVSVLGAVLGCSRTAEQAAEQPAEQAAERAAEPQPAAIPGTPLGELVIGEPIRHANLTIFPISSQVPRVEDRFITLDEGLQAGTVTIREVGADGQSVGQVEVAEDVEEAVFSDDPFARPADETSPVEDSTDEDPPSDAEPPHASSVTDADAPAEAGATVADDTPTDRVDRLVQQRLVQQRLEQEPLVQQEVELNVQTVSGAEVNRLVVINTSGRPLYLMPGEVISGGNQDRTIAQETVIASGEEPVPIDVFCVEQGRWSERAVDEAVEILAASDSRASMVRVYGGHAGIAGEDAGEDAEEDVEAEEQSEQLAEAAERANAGEFVASVGQLSRKARIAVQDDAAQAPVWREVATLNAKTGNTLETANFAGNYADDEIAARFAPYVEHFRERVPARPQVVGVAVAINGKMATVDIFESTPLFGKLWPKLLKSYALDAVAVAKEEAAAGTCAVADCIAFLEQAQQAEAGEVELEGGLTQTKRKTENLVSFSVSDQESEDAAAGVGGGLGGAIHINALAH